MSTCLLNVILFKYIIKVNIDFMLENCFILWKGGVWCK